MLILFIGKFALLYECILYRVPEHGSCDGASSAGPGFVGNKAVVLGDTIKGTLCIRWLHSVINFPVELLEIFLVYKRAVLRAALCYIMVGTPESNLEDLKIPSLGILKDSWLSLAQMLLRMLHGLLIFREFQSCGSSKRLRYRI